MTTYASVFGMRWRNSQSGKLMPFKSLSRLIVVAGFVVSAHAQVSTFRTISADAAPWTQILGSVGIVASASSEAPLVIAGQNAPADAAPLATNHILILEGFSPLAHSLGFVQNAATASFRRVIDERVPSMEIIWEQPVTQPSVT